MRVGVEFTDWLQQHALVILARVLEAIERGADRIVDIPVARGKLITEHAEDGEIDRVGPVRIGGMDRGLDIRGIVEQQIEHVVALMVIGPNDFGVDRDMVGHQGVGDDAFVKPEVFGRIAGIDRGNAGFKPLSITA